MFLKNDSSSTGNCITALFWEILVWIILNQDTVEKGPNTAFQRSKNYVLPCCSLCPAPWRQGSGHKRTVCWRTRSYLCSALAKAPRQQRRWCQSAAGNLLVILTTLTAVLQSSLWNLEARVLVRVYAFCRCMNKCFVLWLWVSKTCWNNCVTWQMHSIVRLGNATNQTGYLSF